MKTLANILATIVFSLPFTALQTAQAAESNESALITQGKYLTQMGDCVSCHTATGSKPFAGGRAIPTPFGAVYAPNITPDKETGIGDWQFEEFWNALHNGTGRDGELLYPVFSYTSFTKATREDAQAIFAYLQSLPAIRQVDRSPNLDMPYNIRPLLYAWRFLYFNPGSYQPNASKSESWNRGAYLVEGLGHCNECHTTRNALGAMNQENPLTGGEIPLQGWYAPNLSTQKGGGLEGWTSKDIIDLLKTGMSERGGAFGPMADVVRNSTQHMNDTDLAAVAEYLQSLPAPAGKPAANTQKAPDYAAGEKLYSNHCSSCHNDDGQGHKGIYPPLGGNSSITDPTALNAIRSVLLGGFPPATPGNPQPYSMPPFAHQLNDQEIAAVVNYIRQSWGNQASAISANDVMKSRFLPTD
ncbi:Cytochrome c, class I [gamma proteobacterium HdN1]|nr:Cytochrome c, class I [gamma proteobacterium HdN1]